MMTTPSIKVGIAGVGAIGSAVAKALNEGIKGFSLECVSDPKITTDFGVVNTDFATLTNRCDLVIECLPANIVPQLALAAFSANTDIIFISTAALLTYQQILEQLGKSNSRAYVPSGALCGIDGVLAMKEMGINSAQIASTKPPKGFGGAPYVTLNNIGLSNISKKTLIFEGNALEAAKGFPANVNVAATLSLAGIGAQNTRVEIWADPNAKGNMHEITVKSDYSTLTSKIENMPDPSNPKSSILAAQSIVATLRNMSSALVISQ